jgi:peptidoglycan hydrolase FlgJ
LAISAAGDIVMDVMRAADPTKVQEARDRLKAMAAGANVDVVFDPKPIPASAPTNISSRPNEAFQRFEAMVLQNFVQSMLPDDTESVYGSGLAGDMWKSMLAEKIGEQIAQRGGIGIADRILADYYMDGDNKVPLQGVDRDPSRPIRDEDRQITTRLVQQIEREIAQNITDRNQSAPASQFLKP